MIDRTPMDENGKHHGLYETYWEDGLLSWKGVYVHGSKYGYFTGNGKNGTWYRTSGYYSNNEKISECNEDGCCYIWEKVEV